MKPVFLFPLLLYSLSNAQWERVQEIPESRTVYTLLGVHDTLYAGTDSVVYVGSNAGTQWSSGIPPVTGPDAVSCMLKDENVLIAGTFQSGIFKSTNDGLSWQPFSAGLSGLGSESIGNLLMRRDSLIAGTLGASVFITAADFTHPWSSWGDSLSAYQGDNVFKMLLVGNTVLTGAGGNGYMFRYTDTQPWWNPIPINTPRLVGQFVWGMSSGSTAAVAGTNRGICRSTDEGLSWERTGAIIPPLTFTISLLYHGTTFFAVTTTPLSSSLLISSDEGKTWESLGEFPIPNILDIAVVGETLFLGGSGGLWKAPLSRLLTGVDVSSPIPSRISLMQNYPNPFNPSTTIEYALPNSGRVSLKIYDPLGQEVATLVNEEMNPGTHQVKWDAIGMPSGVYFYRLQAGDFVASKKLLLLK